MSGVNLLPWRKQRQARCMRFWGVLLIGWLLLMLTIVCSQRAEHTLGVRALRLDLSGIHAVRRALEVRQPSPRHAPREAVQTSRTSRWQPTLVSLAQAMPPQAWLTQLRYQASTLTLTGYAATLPALSAMAEALPEIVGLVPGAAGELQQDSQGRWMFTFRLNGQE